MKFVLQWLLVLLHFQLDLAQQTFPSGLWWIKCRGTANEHQFVDSSRSNDVALTCPTLAAEGTYVPPTDESVAWCWEASDPAKSGFQIINYTGNDTDGRQIPHQLGKEPEFIITKSRDDANQFIVYHKDIGVGYAIDLNLSGGSYAFGAYQAVSPTR